MGIPAMQTLWEELTGKADKKELRGTDRALFKKLVKTLDLLRNNPKHPGLQTHNINALSQRYGFKVWQSYLENRKSAAGRLYWTYGPNRKEITILGIEPHPEDKKRNAYTKIKSSDLPTL